MKRPSLNQKSYDKLVNLIYPISVRGPILSPEEYDKAATNYLTQRAICYSHFDDIDHKDLWFIDSARYSARWNAP